MNLALEKRERVLVNKYVNIKDGDMEGEMVQVNWTG